MPGCSSGSRRGRIPSGGERTLARSAAWSVIASSGWSGADAAPQAQTGWFSCTNFGNGVGGRPSTSGGSRSTRPPPDGWATKAATSTSGDRASGTTARLRRATIRRSSTFSRERRQRPPLREGRFTARVVSKRTRGDIVVVEACEDRRSALVRRVPFSASLSSRRQVASTFKSAVELMYPLPSSAFTAT